MYNLPQPQTSPLCLVNSYSSCKIQLKYYLLSLATKDINNYFSISSENLFITPHIYYQFMYGLFSHFNFILVAKSVQVYFKKNQAPLKKKKNH